MNPILVKGIVFTICLGTLASSLALAQVTYEPYTFGTIAGKAGVAGSVDGTNAAARFNGPSCIRMDGAGNLYVGETYGSTVRKLTPQGADWVVTTVAGRPGVTGYADGAGSAALFSWAYGLAVSRSGNIFVADARNHVIRKVTPTGDVATVAGQAGATGSADGTNNLARFYTPTDIAVDTAGNLFVVELNNCTVRKLTPDGTNWVVTTLAGMAGVVGSADGTGSAARFYAPQGVGVDTAGNIFVADSSNNTLRKATLVGTNWIVTTPAGKAGYAGSADGTNSTARFNSPGGMAIDRAGNIFISDWYNNTVRKVTPFGTNWVVTTLGGRPGVAGITDGSGSAATFRGTGYVEVDGAGNLYVVDGANTIRKGVPVIKVASSAPTFGFHSGQFGFELLGPAGLTAVVESSTNLANWLPIWTNTLANPPSLFSDPQKGVDASHFYRARVKAAD